ncbi:hypothetical protein ACFPM7_14860 [Actinokineospora guangxiensis]|uniref:Uncharacterized protein n=1 Tax=Actinokineospora guangxiensis TaxID=1490288 RepID=A0ABW0ELU1_9PSEU
MPQTERGADGAAVPVVPARPVTPPSPRQGDAVRDEHRASPVDSAQERLVRPGEQPDATSAGGHRLPERHDKGERNDHHVDRSDHRQADQAGDHGARHQVGRQADGHATGGSQYASTDEIPAQREHLFGTQEADGFRERWHRVQGCFVDNPAASVEEADKLVGEAMKALAEHKRSLESWRENGAQTEELRHALRDYRAFLDRLLRV